MGRRITFKAKGKKVSFVAGGKKKKGKRRKLPRRNKRTGKFLKS